MATDSQTPKTESHPKDQMHASGQAPTSGQTPAARRATTTPGTGRAGGLTAAVVQPLGEQVAEASGQATRRALTAGADLLSMATRLHPLLAFVPAPPTAGPETAGPGQARPAPAEPETDHAAAAAVKAVCLGGFELIENALSTQRRLVDQLLDTQRQLAMQAVEATLIMATATQAELAGSDAETHPELSGVSG